MPFEKEDYGAVESETAGLINEAEDTVSDLPEDSSSSVRKRRGNDPRRSTVRMSVANKLARRRSMDGFFHGAPVVDERETPDELNGPFETIFLIVNTMIGAGILNMPQVFAEAGIGLALIMFAMTTWANWTGLVTLVRVGKRLDILDYGALAEFTFGTTGKFVVDGLITLSGYGALLSYFITIGTLASGMAQFYGGKTLYTSYNFILPVTTIFVILPICMVREFGHLIWVSVLSVVSITGVIMLVLIHGPSVGESLGQQPNPVQLFQIAGLKKFGAITFALGAAHSTFHAYRSLQSIHRKNWDYVTLGAMLAGSAMCCVCGIGGYLCFGSEVKAEILDSFPASDAAADVLKFLLILHLILYIPIDFVILRHSLTLIWDQDVLQMPTPSYVTLNAFLVLLCLGITLATKKFGIILDLTGGVAGSFVYFIMPAVISHQHEGLSVTAVVLLMFGLVDLCMTLYFTFIGE